MRKFLIVVTLSGLVLGGCANKTESGALVGAGGGALVGGLVGGWEGAATHNFQTVEWSESDCVLLALLGDCLFAFPH